MKTTKGPLTVRLSAPCFGLLLAVGGFLWPTPKPCAGDGDLDPGFSPQEPFLRAPVVRSIHALKAGGYLVFGDFTQIGSARCSSIGQLTTQGNPVASFNTPWDPASFPQLHGEIRDVLELPDGRFVIGGRFAIYVNGFGDVRYNVAALRPDGSVDVSFYNALATGGAVNALGLQSNGRILVGGHSLTLANATAEMKACQLLRLRADGALDSSYPRMTNAGGFVTRLRVYTNRVDQLDQVAAGGWFFPESPTLGTGYVLLSSNGGVIRSVNGFDAAVLALADGPNNTVLLGGAFTTFQGAPANGIVRVRPDGSRDPGFEPGLGANAEVNAIGLDSLGRVVVAGGFTAFNQTDCGRVARLLPTGVLDPEFQAGAGANERVFDVQVHGADAILLAGAFSEVRGAARGGLAELNANGALAESPGGPTLRNETKVRIYSALKQPDGKILVGGDFTGIGSRYLPGIARLLANGNLDPSFNPGLGVDGEVQVLALQADGRVLAGGYFGPVQGAARSSLARFNPDGPLDASFAPRPTRLDGSLSNLQRIYPLDNGQILILGHIRLVDGVVRDYVARLNENGTLDPEFNPQFLIQGYEPGDPALRTAQRPIPNDVLPLTGGKLLLAGGCVWGGLNAGYLVRLDHSGKPDTAFVPKSVATNVLMLNGAIQRVLLTAQSNILVCGAFSEIRDGSVWDRPQRGRIAQFSFDGASDERFVTRIGADNTIQDMALQSDGRILIAGWFKKYQMYEYPGSNNCTRVGRLLDNGALDVTFAANPGPDDTAYSIAWFPNNRALVTGSFTNYQGTLRPLIGIVQASAARAQPPTLRIRLETGAQLRLEWPSDAAGFVLESRTQLETGAPWRLLGTAPSTAGTNLYYLHMPQEHTEFFRLRER